MDSKFYVSLEAARLLKEKGYDGDAEYAYHEIGNFSHWGRNVNDIDYLYAAPTKSEAIDWLESKGCILEVLKSYKGIWFYVIKTSEPGSYVSDSGDNYSSTRLEAEEAAIIKALELL